jgi:hypothetical protein
MEQKCLQTCKTLLACCEAQDNDFLWKMTGKVLWVCHYHPRSKQAGRKSYHASLTKSESFQYHHLLEWLHWLSSGTCTVSHEWCRLPAEGIHNRYRYILEVPCESLLKFAIRWKQCRLLSGGLCLQHDNTHLYTSGKRVEKMKELSIETSHTCLTRLCTCWYNVFGLLTSAFSWFHFKIERESQCAL